MAYNYVIGTGVIVPDDAAIRAEVQTELEAIFGADQDFSETGFLGKLAATKSLERIGIAANTAKMANQINPNMQEGLFIDAGLALFGGSRSVNIRSTFVTPPTVTGVAGTIIPAGSRASSGSNLFETVGSVTIPLSGTTSINFIAVENGAIPAAIDSLNTIVTGVLGWETVNNTASAVVGVPTESDQRASIKRRETLALNARTGDNAIISAINDIDDVLSVSFRRNVTGSSANIDGITIDANSVYVNVDGGTDADVALALLTKSGGAGFTGDVDVTVVEPSSGQNYTVSINRPSVVEVQVNVTVRSSNSVIDPVSVVSQSIIDYQNGLIGDNDGFVLDADVAPFEIAAAINQRTPALFIQGVTVGVAGGSATSDVLPIALNQKANVLPANISVIVL